MKLELKMASVQYVHTQRFLSEVIAFAQHFLQLQEVLGRIRAASQGDEVDLIIIIDTLIILRKCLNLPLYQSRFTGFVLC